MDDMRTASSGMTEPTGPAKLEAFSHVSLPCRDLEEAKRFYIKVLGGELALSVPTFAYVRICDVLVGMGSEGCSYMSPGSEYPHIAFFVTPEALTHMQRWLTRCGVPTSNLWTRHGVETLMFFRDPSGNVIELYCEKGFAGAEQLPHGPPRGHGTAVDIDALHYDTWKIPEAGS